MTATPAPNQEFMIKFPPFPTAPPGVTITPFNQYKETGIKLFCSNEDGIEVDGLGIPTVELLKKHNTDKCKTDAQKKKKEKQANAPAKPAPKPSPLPPPPRQKSWWEVWKEEEPSKHAGPYNPNTPRLDRLCQSVNDFYKSRVWPKPEPYKLPVHKIWDQFCVFVGISVVLPYTIRVEKAKLKQIQEQVEKESRQFQTGNESDDDDDDDDSDIEGGPIIPEESLPKDPTPSLTTAQPDPDLEEDEQLRNSQRLQAFLNNPETVIKMFLSSYMRKEGLIWSDPNLYNTPRVLFFFLRFILRHRAVPEIEAQLKPALSIVELAQQQLPHTSVVAKVLPCEAGASFRELFGPKAESLLLTTDASTAQPVKNDTSQEDVEMSEAPLEQVTMEYAGNGEWNDVARPGGEGFARIEELTEDDNKDDKRSSKRARIDDNTNTMDVDPQSQKSNDKQEQKNDTGGWGTSTSENTWRSWGTGGGGDGDNLNTAPADAWGATPDEGLWQDPFSQTNDAIWDFPVPSLSKFLGMTALPLTHDTGVVEFSLRRIVSVHEPEKTEIGNALAGAAGVEEHLRETFGRIVLAPWSDWDKPVDASGLSNIRGVYREIAKGKRPEKGVIDHDSENDEDGADTDESSQLKIVWATSRGWVVDPSSGEVVLSHADASGPGGKRVRDKEEAAASQAHDPLKHVIEVLVDVAVLGELKDAVGMGFGGTWVQIVRKEKEKGVEGSEAGVGVKRYWYMEELKTVIPSFYTA
ncbi:hypothetical protein AMATHDRAFT_61135 [Amanita thiersii Skay4041]|uniref:Uncharacterized protein n=1 Tax=Amanita thiersii Skay4041 TaxID=703135 RepID=A0A2A9NRT6_9AGAR|nr:hypothetical protein AMATHDRAFT_61135 [Amanita thiersii Skay4041]